jgi:hypothetical protein
MKEWLNRTGIDNCVCRCNTLVNGIVVILDTLGYKDAIEHHEQETKKNWALFTNSANWGLHQLRREDYRDCLDLRIIDYETAKDSYVIGAWQDNQEIDSKLVGFVAANCNASVGYYMKKRTPLRGCISCGTFDMSDKDGTISGPAVDEARNEFEETTWSGVHATESLGAVLDQLSLKSTWVRNCFVKCVDLPFKKGRELRWVLNWPYAYDDVVAQKDLLAHLEQELLDATKADVKVKKKFTLRFCQLLIEQNQEREYKRSQRRNKPGE